MLLVLCWELLKPTAAFAGGPSRLLRSSTLTPAAGLATLFPLLCGALPHMILKGFSDIVLVKY